MDKALMEKIYNLVENNEDVRFQLENSESVEDIVAILAANGVEISAAAVNEAIAKVNVTDELNEELLSEVSGGYCSKGWNWNCFWSHMGGFFQGFVEGILG